MIRGLVSATYAASRSATPGPAAVTAPASTSLRGSVVVIKSSGEPVAGRRRNSTSGPSGHPSRHVGPADRAPGAGRPERD